MKKIDDINSRVPRKRKSSDGEDLAVAFSINLIGALEKKAQKHNKENPNSKTNLQQLKKVYIQGANNFRAEGNLSESLNLWGLARVNMYLGHKSGDKISINAPEITPSELDGLIFETKSEKIITNYFLDITSGWTPSKENFEKAKEDIKKYSLDYSFSSLEDVYLEYKQIELQWE
jgi:hypothetical protein